MQVCGGHWVCSSVSWYLFFFNIYLFEGGEEEKRNQRYSTEEVGENLEESVSSRDRMNSGCQAGCCRSFIYEPSCRPFILFFLRRNPESTHLARLARGRAPPMSVGGLGIQIQTIPFTSTFFFLQGCWGSEIKSSCLQSKHFPKQPVFPDFILPFLLHKTWILPEQSQHLISTLPARNLQNN